MDAEHGRPALEREHVRGCRRDRALTHLTPGQLAEERLARDAEHDWAPERDQLVEPGNQREVVLDGLAEADAGVEHHARFRDPLGDRERQPRLEERLDVGDDVVVPRVVLHRARLPEHVHEAAVGAGLGHHPRQLGIEAEG